MDTQTYSAGGLEQDEHVVEKKPSYMNRVKAKARKIRDSIGSKMQNHDDELDEEDHFDEDAPGPEKEPEIHGEVPKESPALKTGSDNLNSGTTPGDAETSREYGEAGVPEPKKYSSEHAESCPTGLNFGEKTDTEQSKSNLGVPSSVEEPKIDLDVDVTSTPLEVEKAAVISELDCRPTLDFDNEPSVEVPLEAEKTAVISELNSTIPRIDSEKPYKWNLESNLEVTPELEAEKEAVITEINSSITRMDSEKPYTTTSLETNSATSTPLEADKENAAPTWMDFEKENAEQTMDQFGTDSSKNHHSKLTDLTVAAGAKEADVEPMTRSFGEIDIAREPESTFNGTDGHDKFSSDSTTHPTATDKEVNLENTEDFYEAKSDNMNVDEEPNANLTYTEKKPSAPAAIAATAASTIIGTSISAKDTVASKLGYNGNDSSNIVTKDAKETDTEGTRSIGEETKSPTAPVGDYGQNIVATATEKLAPVYEKFGGAGTGGVSKDTSSVADSGTETGTGGVGFVTDHNTGASVKDYLVEKLSPGDEGKPLLEVFSEVMHKPKDEFPEKVAENMDKVTESPEVTKRLGTDERGYERDEDESFGTDGGSLGGGSSFGGATGMESPAASKMGEQIKEHDTGVTHKPKEESPEVAARLGTDERGYERDDDDSFGTDAIRGSGEIESPTADKGMVDRAKGLVNYYWYGNEAGVKPDDVGKVADAGAEAKKDDIHETSTTGVVGEK